MKNNILNKLKGGYDEMEIKPSAGLWERLDQKLDEKPERNISKSSFGWWQYAAVLLLLISVGTIIYLKDKNQFEDHRTDYLVKQRVENPVKPGFKSQSVISSQEKKEERNMTGAVAAHSKTDSEELVKAKQEIKTEPQQLAAFADEEIAVKLPLNTHIKPDDREILPVPVVAEVGKAKSSYINADELLMGREFDKTREEAKKDERRFGVFNINKVFHKVDNLTVLGVTVYTDIK